MSNANTFQQTYTWADHLVDARGTYLLIQHNLGALYPLGFMYTNCDGGLIGSWIQLWSVDENAVKYYTPEFGDPHHIRVVT
jgi:hypothetical protein